MIEVENFWHLKTFEAVLTNLQRRQDKEIHKQKDGSLHCTENDNTNGELDGKEVIDLCSEKSDYNQQNLLWRTKQQMRKL